MFRDRLCFLDGFSWTVFNLNTFWVFKQSSFQLKFPLPIFQTIQSMRYVQSSLSRKGTAVSSQVPCNVDRQMKHRKNIGRKWKTRLSSPLHPHADFLASSERFLRSESERSDEWFTLLMFYALRHFNRLKWLTKWQRNCWSKRGKCFKKILAFFRNDFLYQNFPRFSPAFPRFYPVFPSFSATFLPESKSHRPKYHCRERFSLDFPFVSFQSIAHIYRRAWVEFSRLWNFRSFSFYRTAQEKCFTLDWWMFGREKNEKCRHAEFLEGIWWREWKILGKFVSKIAEILGEIEWK